MKVNNAKPVFNPEQIKKEIKPLNLTLQPGYSKNTYHYFQHYQLDTPNILHYFGTFIFKGNKIFTHVYKPQAPKGTVVCIHGYFDHTGALSPLIHQLLEQSYTVVSFDLPGHGLSDGEKCFIRDFSEYAGCLSECLKQVRNDLEGPYHLTGFSTGASAIVELLLNQKNESPIGKIILLAPLIKSFAWKSSLIGYHLVHPITSRIPRMMRRDCSNKEFHKFRKQDDLLQLKYTNLDWVTALLKWNRQNKNYPQSERSIHIFQGDHDTTVLWKYNLSYLQKKFKSVKINLIKKGRHQLINENAAIQTELFAALLEILKNKKPE